MLDAYTIRKMLPRIVIAAILISLSWPLLSFLVQLSNDLGNGVRVLIYSPFSSLLNSTSSQINFNQGAFGVDLFALGAFTALGGFGLLSFVLTGVLAVLVGYITLVIRQFLMIGLLILSPIAIVAYIMPNTEKFFKIWRSTLIGVLLAFPIIAAFIATGRVFSAISAQQGGAINQVIAFAAYFAPYFMLPLAFKMSGGIMSGIGTAVHNRSGGLRKSLSTYRGNKTKENLQKTANFSRFSDNNKFGHGLNMALGTIANPRSISGGVEGIRNTSMAKSILQGAAQYENDPIAKANPNDSAMHAAVANPKYAQDQIDKYTRSGDTAKADYWRRAQEKANQVKNKNSAGVRAAAFNKWTGSGFDIPVGQEADRVLADTAKSISGNNTQMYTSLMNQAKYNTKSAGRYDTGKINGGASYDFEGGYDSVNPATRANGKTQTYYGAAQNFLGNSVMDRNVDPKTNVQRDGSSTLSSSDEIYQAMTDQMRAMNQAEQEKYLQGVIKYHGSLLTDSFSGASDANKAEIAKQVAAIESFATEPSLPDSFTQNIVANKNNLVAQMRGGGGGGAS